VGKLKHVTPEWAERVKRIGSGKRGGGGSKGRLEKLACEKLRDLRLKCDGTDGN
jgi:hypothetical protein